ncbi:MAG: hypoxanthine phosphoribosyltransferase [Chlamydiales bacterium]|nr:hypoxanthine phosphoribosyltransferase [Chlamydiales bacterium]
MDATLLCRQIKFLDMNLSHLELLISEQNIVEKISEVAAQLDADFNGREVTIVMIMKGAICLVADLIRHLHSPCSLEFIQTSSYGQKGTERGALSFFGLEKVNVAGKHVLLVDDIFDSGVTLSEAVKRLKEQNPETIKSLVLLSKNVPHKTDYRPDYALFEIENRFVVGYGLDYKEYYRGLPGVYAMVMEGK